MVFGRAFCAGAVLSSAWTARIQRQRRSAGDSAATATDCYSMYDGKPLVQLNATKHEELDAMSKVVRGLECTEAGEEDFNELMAICPKSSVATLQEKYGNQFEVLEDDAGGFYRQTSGKPGMVSSLASDFYADWRNYDARLGRVQALVEASDGVAAIEEIGRSVEGRPIYVVRLRGSRFKGGQARVVANFQQHAREWIAGMTGVYAVEQAIQRAIADPSWLAGMELMLVPLANPDGIVYSETSDRMWRKNRRINTGSRCMGVDLNRNWLPAWELSTDYCGQTNGGASAFSEPEAEALRKVIDEFPTTLHLDVHAYSELIIAPFGYTRTVHPRRKELDVPGLAMQKAIKDTHGKEYQYGGSEVLYGSKGVARDYIASKDGFGWTIELRPSRNGRGGFAPPTTEILPTAEEFMAALYAAIDWAKAPFTTPAPTPAPSCSWTCNTFGCGWGSCQEECYKCV